MNDRRSFLARTGIGFLSLFGIWTELKSQEPATPQEPPEEKDEQTGWYASRNEVNWSNGHTEGPFVTREEAIVAGHLMAVEWGIDGFWTGFTELYEPETSGFGEDVTERLSERAYESVGEFAETWLDHHEVTREMSDELDSQIADVLDAWIKKHALHPGFWSVDKVKHHEHDGCAGCGQHMTDGSCHRCIHNL